MNRLRNGSGSKQTADANHRSRQATRLVSGQLRSGHFERETAAKNSDAWSSGSVGGRGIVATQPRHSSSRPGSAWPQPLGQCPRSSSRGTHRWPVNRDKHPPSSRTPLSPHRPFRRQTSPTPMRQRRRPPTLRRQSQYGRRRERPFSRLPSQWVESRRFLRLTGATGVIYLSFLPTAEQTG